MDVTAAFLVVLSAFLHASWNALLKRERDTKRAAVVGLLWSAFFSVLPAFFEGGPAFPTRLGFLLALGAGLFEAGYFATLSRSLQRAPLGVVYPIARGGALALIWPVSVFWLGELFYVWSAFGLAALLVGLLLSSRSSGSAATREGIFWAILCACFVAGYNLCYKKALQEGAHPIVLCAVSLSLSTAVSVVGLGREGIREGWVLFRSRAWLFVLIGFISALSFLVFLVALRQSGAGAALTLRNLSIVFALLFGRLLGERLASRQVLGALLLTAGAILVSLR